MEVCDIMLGNISCETECNLDKIVSVQCKDSVATIQHLYVAFGLKVILTQPLKLGWEVLLETVTDLK
jgi:hypothetical protein